MGMASLKTCELDDPRLDVYARLTDAQLRSRLEPERGILIAESPNVIERALEAELTPLSLLTSEGRSHIVADLIEEMGEAHPELPIFVIPDEEFERLTGFKLTRGALAAFRRPPLPTVDEVVKNARRICVLENITNHMNVGSIFRSAAALGIDGVLVGSECSDPFYRRAIRVSMGGVFQVPWTVLPPHGEARAKRGPGSSVAPAIEWLRDRGFTCIALALEEGALELGDPQINGREKLALALGTEGTGLMGETIEACDHAVVIPMHHGVDSLNVAAASAIAFWETRSRS